MKYLVLGSNGMAGHIIYLYLRSQGHEVTGFSRSNAFNFDNIIIGDALDFKSLELVISKNNFDIIINAIGLLNNVAEKKILDSILLNSYLPHFLENITKKTQTKIFHISTDCVFSGYKGNYIENDLRDGTKWYDRTKALGEIDNLKDLTIRTSIIGPELNKYGIGLMHWFLTNSESKVYGYKNVYWSGVTTLYLAKAIEFFSNKSVYGIYHLVNNNKISKYDLLNLMNINLIKRQKEIIPKYNPKADKSLLNTRGKRFIVPSYQEMIFSIGKWIDRFAELYPHYI